MKTVEFTTDLRPYRKNDVGTLPDDVADRLVASGDAINPRPWPANAAPQKQRRGKLSLPNRGGDYQTKQLL